MILYNKKYTVSSAMNNTFIDVEKGLHNTENETPDIENGLLSGMTDVKEILQEKLSNIPGKTLQDKLSYLSYCNCCARHQVLKPKNLAPWVDTDFHNTNNSIYCECDCRHLSRFICRQV